jgi:ABC-type amino acid transport substrate-binding protein
MDFLKKIIEQFEAFFQLHDHLSPLSNTNPYLAGAVVFVLTLFVANIAITQLIEFRKRFFGGWIHNRFAWAVLIVGICLAALVSAGVVLNLRKATAAVPTFVVKSDVVIGPMLLGWRYANAEKTARFELQSARNSAFSEDVRKEGYKSGLDTLVEHINDKRYWKVRAVDTNNRGISDWSPATLIAQYDTSLMRISKTRYVSVYISNSFNEAFFKYYSKDANSTLKGFDIAIIDEIIKKLPDHLGIDDPLKHNPVAMPWKDLLNAPRDAGADIIISTITSLPEREGRNSIKFSRPYYCTTQAIVYRPPLPSQSIARILEKQKVGVQGQTTSQSLIDKFGQEIPSDRKFDLSFHDQAGKMLAALVNNEIDYGLTDTPFALVAQRQYGAEVLGVKELINEEDFPKGLAPEQRVENYAVAVRRGESVLINAIDQIIGEMKKKRLGELLEEAVTDYYNTHGSPNDAPLIDKNNDPSICRSS